MEECCQEDTEKTVARIERRIAAEPRHATVIKDREGLVVNPHALPNNEEHASITCGDCHKMHAADSVSATSTKKCASCHHQGVFECGTCA